MTADRSNANIDYGNPTSWNRYAYTNGDPVNGMDPSGQSSSVCYSTTGAYIPDVCVTIPDGASFSSPDDSTVTDVTNYTSITVSDDPNAMDPYDSSAPAPDLYPDGSGPNSTSSSSAPNSGLTKKQAACAADAAINGALSIFVPGYAAAKTIASFEGFSLNIVGGLTGTSGLFSGGDPTLLQTGSGLAGANQIYQDSRFAAAGGASALARVQNLTSRVGFGAQTAGRQGRLLSQLGSLESLEGAASFASKANNIAAGISAGYDIYKCVTTP